MKNSKTENLIVGEVIQIIDKTSDKYPTKSVIVKTVSQSGYEGAVKIEFKGTNMDKLDGVSEGRLVEIKCYLGGRTYTNKDGQMDCFNSVSGVDLSFLVDNGEAPKVNSTAQQAPVSQSMDDDDSDLPF
jgi:hypothetical protein